ncbi:hypothetical protein D3C80_1509310 [compost metagenome]
MIAVGEGNAEPRSHGACRGDAWHDFDRDVFSLQRCDLLAGASKNHRIAGFQPHYPFAGLGKADHHVVNIFLLAAFPAAAFANKHTLRLPPRQFQHLG